MLCEGAPALIESLQLPEQHSFFADEGSLAHDLAAHALTNDWETIAHEKGSTFDVGQHTVEVTDDMVRAVDEYCEAIRLAGWGHRIFVEHKIDCRSVLGKGRSGTGDVIILPKDEGLPVEFHDFKYGQGVEVFAEKNRQCLIYAASFIASHSLSGYSKAKIVIHQPRIKSAPDEWLVDIEKVLKWAAMAKKKAKVAHFSKPGENLTAGETQCRWCPAKEKCPEFDKAMQSVFADIDELSEYVEVPEDRAELARKYSMIPLAEMWIKTIKAAGYAVLDAGEDLPGFKFVEGRKGDRYFEDPEAAAERIKQFRVKNDDMYINKLKSPTQISKVITKIQYQKLEEEGYIKQDEGKPTVTSSSDARPTIVKGPMFENLDDNDDLI